MSDIDEYVGAAVLELDGRDIDVTKISARETTGTKVVKTMNRKRRAKGVAKGIGEYTLNITAVIPLDGAVDWVNIEGAKVTIDPVSGSGGKRVSYLNCFAIEVGEEYNVEGEAVVDIQLGALDKVIE
jgi:hypothetical protein